MLPLGLRLIQRALPGTLHADLAACDSYRDVENLPIACPVLLLQGTVDRMTPPRGAKAFVEKLASADIRMLDGIGHMVMAEAPHDVTAALRDFIR
jgi:pimeloyl-ACP methyl ester carboxylesterase